MFGCRIMGWNRPDQVEVPGDFAVRGGIIDSLYAEGDFEESAEQVGLTVRVDFFWTIRLSRYGDLIWIRWGQSEED